MNAITLSDPEPSTDLLLEEARTAKRAKEKTTYKAACEAWLASERGIHVGDTVKLHYSNEEREVVVETFELHWPTGQAIDIPTLVFEGPTLHKGPRRVERSSNWCSRATSVSKVPAPSAYLRRKIRSLAAGLS